MKRNQPFRVVLAALSLIFTAPIWSALTSSTAQAQDECAAQMPAESGWRVTGASNMTANGYVGRSVAEMIDYTERLTIRAKFSTGWQQVNLTSNYFWDGGTMVQVGWAWSYVNPQGVYMDAQTHPWIEGPFVTMATYPVCKSGYQLSWPYGGSAVCVVANTNLRSCPTDVKPDKNRGCNADSMEGNPCNVATGNKYQKEVDYAGPERSHLRYERHYNSDATTPIGIHGSQWRGTYDRYLVFSSDYSVNTVHSGDEEIYVQRPDGRIIHFVTMGGIAPKDSSTTERLSQVDERTWQFTDADGTIETYKLGPSNGLYWYFARLEAMQFSDGRKLTLSYAAASPWGGTMRLATVQDEFGHKLSFTHNANNQVTTITDPAGNTYTYNYDASGYLTKVTYPDTRFRQYTYGTGGNAGALTSIVDESGTPYGSWTYDSDRRAVSSEHAGGADSVTFTYNTNGTSTATDALGSTRSYAFNLIDGARKLSSRTDSAGSAQVTYDSNGFVASRTDRRGVQTVYSHDARGLETSRTEAYGTSVARTVTTQWHSTLRLPTLLTEPNRMTAYTYDANGNVLTLTVTDTATSESRTWTYTYDSYGRQLTANGPRTDVSDVTTSTYYTCTTGYQCGQVQTITNALGHVMTYNTYNAHGQPLTMTDANGLVTTLTYDARQRLTSRTAGGEQTTFEYWPAGLLKKATLPDSSFLEYAYDGAHRLTQINDAEGNHVVYTLDAMGNRTAEQVYDPSNALAQARTRVFNTLNQLWKEIGAAGTTNVTTVFSYDADGNRTGINAPLSRNTVQSHDELNRLEQVTDPLSGNTQYAYNALDQLISVTDPRSKVTSYTYNAFGDLTQQVSPDTGTTSNTYDFGGNLLTSTDARSKIATYDYDALDRVASLSYPDQTISYAYDSGTNQKGRLTHVSDGSGSTSWSYDAHGRVLSKQQSMGMLSKTLGYAYDSAGRLQTATLPSGNTVTYGYTDGKVTSLTLNGSTTFLSNVLYQPLGPTRGWTWGNSTLAIREYDPDGKVTDIDSAGLKTYTYDDAFRIIGIADASNSSLSQSYGYDLLDRVTSASGTSLNQGWTYDANGNRLTQTGSQASTYTVSATSNRLSSVSGAFTRTHSYDNSGNTTNDGTTTFTYNDAGRMVSATKASVTTTYLVNALGQRVKKTSGGSSTYFVYDEAGHLAGEYDNAGTLIQETVWFGDIPVATLKPNGAGGVNVFYVHTDHLNTPRRISRPSDNIIVWRWDSDPFGVSGANQDPDGDTQLFTFNLRFPGQYFDSETGLHYNYFRDCFDPATGRYCQPDPFLQPNRFLSNHWAFYVPFMLRTPGQLHPYSYVRSNPLWAIDPLGLQEESPIDETGAGQRAQAACDAEAARADAEQEAADARSRGDYENYKRLMRRANLHLREYYRQLGTPLNPADYGAE